MRCLTVSRSALITNLAPVKADVIRAHVGKCLLASISDLTSISDRLNIAARSQTPQQDKALVSCMCVN